MLLRRGIVYSSGAPWAALHDRWLCALAVESIFDTPGFGTAFDMAYDACWPARRGGSADAAIIRMAADGDLAPVVDPAGLLAGVASLPAFGLAVESGTGTG